MSTAHERELARRTVSGVVAAMVAAVSFATATGFWLSYSGLHVFALRSGLHGPEAWAWPSAIDLFILVGEAGVTVSALRRRKDKAAWVYLGVGFAASVTANVLHVDPAELHWTRYAVAAVPPCAAMLALAALLRHVYQLAADRHVALQKAALKADTERAAGHAPRPRSGRKPRRVPTADVVKDALAADPDITTRQLAVMTGVSDRTVRRARARLNGGSTQ